MGIVEQVPLADRQAGGERGDVTAFRSKPENCVLDPDAFAPLQDGWEYTAIPVLDASEVLGDGKTPICFQPTMATGLAALKRLGLEPLTPDDIEFLHAEAVAGRCIELPAFTGTPIAETSLEHRRKSDEANRANARAMGWKPGMRLCNFGKGIVDGPGRPADGMWLMGWRVDRLERYSPAKGQPGHRSGPGFIQPRPTPGRAPHGLDAQADDGTNLWGKRRVTVDPTGDTDPAPGSTDWTGAVTGALRAALEPSAAAIRAAIDRGGHVLPPPPSHSPGGHVLPIPKASPVTVPTPDFPFVASFVQAKNFRRGRIAKVRLVVLHDMEAAESTKTAENVAAWFAGPHAPMASAHFNCDSDTVVQSVRMSDTAFHAPGANQDGIGIEMAGYAKQTAAEWADPFSTAMLARVAQLVAAICAKHELPIAYVDEAGLLGGLAGVTTHAAVSKAFKKSTHTDPGANFPLAAFLDQVRALV